MIRRQGLWYISPLLAGIVLFSPLAHAEKPVDLLPTPDDAELSTSKRMFSDTEIRLLQELESRRLELERREQALRVREKLVDLAEARLGARVDRLEALHTALEGQLKNMSDKEEQELTSLAKIYEEMRPANAATVLDRLDDKIVFDLFKRMNRKSTAKIMEKMSPAKARIVSKMLADKSELPDF